jgi:hypothetical protein
MNVRSETIIIVVTISDRSVVTVIMYSSIVLGGYLVFGH